jgi:hypothetical protein
MVVSQDSLCHRTTSAGRCDPHGQSDKTNRGCGVDLDKVRSNYTDESSIDVFLEDHIRTNQ